MFPDGPRLLSSVPIPICPLQYAWDVVLTSEDCFSQNLLPTGGTRFYPWAALIEVEVGGEEIEFCPDKGLLAFPEPPVELLSVTCPTLNQSFL